MQHIEAWLDDPLTWPAPSTKHLAPDHVSYFESLVSLVKVLHDCQLCVIREPCKRLSVSL